MELLGKFSQLVRTERKITHLILEYISEIDRRRLYLELAYPSLYEFLVRGHGYSPSAAMRRIDSARLLREVPETAAKIQDGSLNLSQISQVQQAIRHAQKQEKRKVSTQEKQDLLKRIENTTQAILSQELHFSVPKFEKQISHQDESVSLTIHLSLEEKEILEKVKNLLSHSLPDQSWVGLITYLAKSEIKRRMGSQRKTKQPKEKMAQLRPVSSGIKKSLLSLRSCCEYKDAKTGKQCFSKKFLEVDHIQPVWAGGDSSLENLRILCSQHNKYFYQKQSRTNFI